MMKAAEENQSNGSFNLARQQSFYQAKAQALTLEEEEAQKVALIDEQKTVVNSKLEELYILQKFAMTPTVVEQEFFNDNSKLLK